MINLGACAKFGRLRWCPAHPFETRLVARISPCSLIAAHCWDVFQRRPIYHWPNTDLNLDGNLASKTSHSELHNTIQAREVISPYWCVDYGLANRIDNAVQLCVLATF